MQRFGQIIGIKPEAIAEYERLHSETWPGVLATIYACNIRNYSIFRHENTLFAYFEYIGEDYAADMAKMEQDPVTQRWWDLCEPMQVPFPETDPDDWWTVMKEVFHTD